MSSYVAITKHPKTGKQVQAWWLDDYFGKHLYGVRFLDEIKVYDPRKTKLTTKETTK